MEREAGVSLDREMRCGVEPYGATWTGSGSDAHIYWIQHLCDQVRLFLKKSFQHDQRA